MDSTNFQPDLTLRNAIRKAVEERNVAPVYVSGFVSYALLLILLEDRALRPIADQVCY